MKQINLSNSIAYLKLRQIFAGLGIFAFVVGVSYYFENGYLDIDVNKYWIFMRISMVIVPVWMVLRIIDFIRDGEYRHFQEIINAWGAKEYFVILFVIAGGISTLTSQYRDVSLKGVDGWYMGYITQLLMIGIYLMAADLFSHLSNKHMWAYIGVNAVFIVPVLILGFLNRFSIFPVHMFGEAEDFISTLGNINWFCGYWTIWTGIGCGLYIRAQSTKMIRLMGVYVWMSAVVGVCCGASSCYLAWMAISFVALLIVLEDRAKLIRWIYMQIIAICSLPFIRLVGFIRPYRMWYDSSWLKEVTYGSKWIIPFVAGIVICLLAIMIVRKIPYDYSRFRGIFIGAAVGVVALYFILMMLNTYISGGIWPARGHSFMYWNNSWGNGRGGIWRASVQMVRDMPGFTLIFGVGCDCFGAFAYSYASMINRLYHILGTAYLTNAHNEILTMLINEGVFGLIVYIGLIASHAKCAISRIDGNPVILGILLAIAGYVAIGMVGFMHLLSTPFFFIIMGMLAGLNAKST